MSTPPNTDPCLDQAAVTDDSLLLAHEKLLGKQPDERAHYRLLPLNLLFIFSGLIFFAGTYLNKYSAHFDPHVYNEDVPQGKLSEATAAPVLDPVEVGRKIYNTPGNCVSCHQPTGLGTPGAIPPLAESEWANGSEERIIRIALYGLQGPIKVKGVDFPPGAMPPFGKVAGGAFNLSDEKIAAVLTYVRQEWGNKGAPVTKEKVAEIHTKEADHKPFTAEELQKLP